MLLVGPPVEALREWLERADIKTGRSPGDRPMGGGGEKALTPQSINLIVKRRCAMAGWAGGVFGARTRPDI